MHINNQSVKLQYDSFLLTGTLEPRKQRTRTSTIYKAPWLNDKNKCKIDFGSRFVTYFTLRKFDLRLILNLNHSQITI